MHKITCFCFRVDICHRDFTMTIFHFDKNLGVQGAAGPRGVKFVMVWDIGCRLNSCFIPVQTDTSRYICTNIVKNNLKNSKIDF